MTKFVKGESGNINGRPKGSKNRNSEGVRQALLKLLDENIDNLAEDLKSLKGKERANLLIALAKHLTAPALNPEKLTEEQMTEIINYLQEHENTQKKAL